MGLAGQGRLVLPPGVTWREARLALAKAQYRALAKRHHPDAGGSHEAMVALNDEYDALVRAINSAPAARPVMAAEVRSFWGVASGRWRAAKSGGAAPVVPAAGDSRIWRGET